MSGKTKPRASQRLFLPLTLKEVDSPLYADTDSLFTFFFNPHVDDIWSLLKEFNSTQVAAMAPEHEEPRIGRYSLFATHLYCGKAGVNSGVTLTNMTSMRRKCFKNDMTTVRLQWGDTLMTWLKKYKGNMTRAITICEILCFFILQKAFLFSCVNGSVIPIILYMEAVARKQKQESLFFMGTGVFTIMKGTSI